MAPKCKCLTSVFKQDVVFLFSLSPLTKFTGQIYNKPAKENA